MLIQNADRTTYGINKIVVFVLAFVVFFVVGFVSWQWDGVAPEPWRLRTLVLTPLTMSLLLYVCCDQFGVYYRCQTLWESIRRFVVAYACFVVLSVMIWKFFVPFSADVGVQTLAYLLTFLGSLWLRISRFRAEKRLVEEASSVARCLVELCGKMGVDFYASMVVSMPAVHKTYFGVIGGTRMLVYKSTPIPYTTSWQLKKMLDWTGALALLVGTSPLWVLAAVGIKLSDRGPVFYRQKRSGLYGQEFGMWKFRTMYWDADKRLDEVKAKYGNDMDGPIFKLEHDPRIFSFGRFLRKFSIDELPQLINVLKGEMSLVGPRPLPVYETEAFTSDAHRRRLSVLPGVTGYWQIAGRSNIREFEKLVELDMKYIDNWSLWLDIKLLLKTVPAVLFARGAK